MWEELKRETVTPRNSNSNSNDNVNDVVVLYVDTKMKKHPAKTTVLKFSLMLLLLGLAISSKRKNTIYEANELSRSRRMRIQD
jgi:hypothetical protein